MALWHASAEPRRGLVFRMSACGQRWCTCSTVRFELRDAAADAADTRRAFVDYDLAARRIERKRDDGALLVAPLDEAWLLAQLAGAAGTIFAERLRRLRARQDRYAWRAYDWASHPGGTMVAFCELFPADDDLVAQVDGQQVWMVDKHCVNPACRCRDVFLEAFDLGGAGAAKSLGHARLAIGKGSGVKIVACDAAVRPFVDVVRADEGLRSMLHERHEEARRVARRLVTWAADQADPEPALRLALQGMSTPSPDAIERPRAIGAAIVVPRLTAIFDDPTTMDRQRERVIWVAVELNLLETTALLVAGLAWGGLRESELEEIVIGELGERGEAAVEPLLAALDGADDAHDAILQALVETRARDERIFAELVVAAERDPAVWADALANFAALGALALTTILRELLTAPAPDLVAARSVAAALRRIDELDPDLEQQLAAATPVVPPRLTRAERLAADAAAKTSRPGRNDPCWCGSGTKYKKCHHDADADAARAR